MFSPNDIGAYKKLGVGNLEWMPPKRPQLKTGAVEPKGKQVHVELWALRAHPSDPFSHDRADASASD